MNFNDLKSKALSKDQMREIKGGSGTCGVITATGSVFCNVEKEVALFYYADGGEGANWCCDSCSGTRYCG